MTGINCITIFSGAQVRPGLMDIVQEETVGWQIDHGFFCPLYHGNAVESEVQGPKSKVRNSGVSLL